MIVFFEFEPERASRIDRIKYRAAKIIYGAYPPHSGIAYIWNSAEQPAQPLTSPYSARIKVIPVENGASRQGSWRTEERNVYEDYRTVFETEPPPIQSVATMTDTT